MRTELDRILNKYTASGKGDGSLLGVAFAIRGRGGKVIYDGSAGKSNFSKDTAFNKDTVCEIMSMTKLVTAVAVMQVVEKGLLALDDDLSGILPNLSELDLLEGFDSNGQPILGRQARPITLRLLLTHSSGFGYDVFDPDLIHWRETTNPGTDFTPYSREALNIPLKFQPGQGWIYGIGLDWAGCIVEAVTGLTLEQYMQENIFVPLEMKSTTFRLAEHPKLQKRLADMSLRSLPRGPLTLTGAFKQGAINLDTGGGGLYSTAADYVKLLEALLDDGRDILTTVSIRKLCVPQLLDPKHLEANFYGSLQSVFCPEYPHNLPVNFALGGAVNMEDIPEKRQQGSIMWSGATNPHWWFDPKSGIAATLFVQVLPPGDAVVADLYDELERAVYANKDWA